MVLSRSLNECGSRSPDKIPARYRCCDPSGNARRFELVRFGVADLAERDADFHAEPTDFSHRLDHLLEFFRAITHPAPRCAHAETRRALCARTFCRGQNFVDWEQFFPLDTGGIMRTLRAVRAVFTATTGLDAEQAATLHLFATPMFEMRRPALRDQIEERLLIESVEFFEIHRGVTMVNRKSAI